MAAADGSVGRIFDGHVNAVERIAVHAATPLCEELLLAVVRDGLRLGVWGADPAPGEGEPATLRAGTARTAPRRSARARAGSMWPWSTSAIRTPMRPAWWPSTYVTARTSRSTRAGFSRPGLRASVSHRVVFDAAPVLAILGRPGALTTDPWFSRDALRTAATWAGMADTAAEAALVALAARPVATDLESLAAGRIAGARATIDAWLATGDGGAGRPTTGGCRRSQSTRAPRSRRACRTLLDEALRAVGSRAIATGGTLDRARRDLELLLLQHRLDPLVARAGARELEARR